MNDKKLKIFLLTFLVLGSLFFLFFGLVKAKSFLIPLTTAIILSMVMNPVALKFMKWGIGRAWAVVFADLVVVAFITFMIFLLFAQANQVANNWDKIENRIQPKAQKVEDYFNKKLNISSISSSDSQQSSSSKDQQKSKKQKKGSDKSFGGNIQKKLQGLIKNIFSFLSNMLLILVYIFFFMYYNEKFRNAILGFVPESKKEKAKTIITKSSRVAQQYLLGRFILILILAILYTIAYGIIGIKYFIFISLIAAIFSLIPYLGNIMGLVLAIGASAVSGGSTGQIIAIVITFSIIQFVESYILEPFVVGDKVDINPVIVIVGVVLGSLVWGIMGMILVIPILGIFKVIFDNIDPLKPLGYVLDERDVTGESGWVKKLQGWFKKKEE